MGQARCGRRVGGQGGGIPGIGKVSSQDDLLPGSSAVCSVCHSWRGGGCCGSVRAGYLGELTQIVPFEMVDAVLESTRTVQARVRALPSRVVVYLLLAAALFAEVGYGQVWARMAAGLDGIHPYARTG